MIDIADRITRDDIGRTHLHGVTGVDYVISPPDSLRENLRTCNVASDRDLLLDALNYLTELEQ